MTDPTRHTIFCCPDCATERMVSTSLPGYCDDGSNGALVIVVHSDTCPWLAALPEDDRYQPDDNGVIQHLTAAQTPDGTASR